MDRRRFLQCTSALGLGLGLASRLGAQPGEPAHGRPTSAARYHVLLLMSGGVDNIFTVDPKRARDVEPSIDVPFGPQQILQRDGLELGPHYEALGGKAPMLGVVNGVRTGTAGHIAGNQSFLRLKEGAPTKMPSILDLLARKRDTQPLPSVSIGTVWSAEHTSDFFGVPDAHLGGDGTDLFGALAGLSPDELHSASKALARHAQSLAASGDALGAANARAVSSLFARLVHVRPLEQPLEKPATTTDQLQLMMDRALWVIENDLASGVFVHLGQGGTSDWDSHLINELIQRDMNVAFARVFDRFLGELGKRKNQHGPLLAQTQVIAGSELGRFPRLNDGGGKDHFPQSSFILAGSNTAAGVAHGGTGREMEGLRVSLRDGQPSKDGSFVQLGDVGASVLWRAGIDPAPYGYHGNLLRFLWS